MMFALYRMYISLLQYIMVDAFLDVFCMGWSSGRARTGMGSDQYQVKGHFQCYDLYSN